MQCFRQCGGLKAERKLTFLLVFGSQCQLWRLSPHHLDSLLPSPATNRYTMLANSGLQLPTLLQHVAKKGCVQIIPLGGKMETKTKTPFSQSIQRLCRGSKTQCLLLLRVLPRSCDLDTSRSTPRPSDGHRLPSQRIEVQAEAGPLFILQIFTRSYVPSTVLPDGCIRVFQRNKDSHP